jgi:N-acetyl-anhydromuramyl-L-alanine amidase AmpD
MRSSNLVHVAMLAMLAACSGACSGAVEEDPGASVDALSTEGTPDTTLTRMFLKPATTSFERGRPGAIRYIVIHDIEGSASSAINTFRNHGAQTSAHYVVDSGGAIVQMVHEHDIANHAGHALFNAYAIGIEHAGHTNRDEYTDAEYRSSAKLVADIAARHRIPIDAQHIVGHSQVPRVDEVLAPCSRTSKICGGHSQHDDPGPFWSWSKYMALVTAAAQAIGYSGEGAPDPSISAAPAASLDIGHALPGAFWITQCAAPGSATEGMQTAFRTLDAESRIESRYVQRAVDPCGTADHGVFPLVFHGFAQSDVHGLTVHACDHGTKHAYSVAGEVPCGADVTCAVASLVGSTAGGCP